MTEEIMNAISSEVYGVWFLIGAALVFWMQDLPERKILVTSS